MKGLGGGELLTGGSMSVERGLIVIWGVTGSITGHRLGSSGLWVDGPLPGVAGLGRGEGA
ncbi:hypothetical protein TIFTF001_005437 [Ficus carica]|uniref:Uncharacterized protein n=1 Tax=Ficus carica TaxID=3494 RepID=A0AA88A1L6_FICCA|nr:hypothetical protein TIFTF001_005437 [Ficus carica]